MATAGDLSIVTGNSRISLFTTQDIMHVSLQHLLLKNREASWDGWMVFIWWLQDHSLHTPPVLRPRALIGLVFCSGVNFGRPPNAVLNIDLFAHTNILTKTKQNGDGRREPERRTSTGTADEYGDGGQRTRTGTADEYGDGGRVRGRWTQKEDRTGDEGGRRLRVLET